MRRVYGADSGIRVPSFIRFGSWIGGDRDGNPFVKPETTELAVRMHHELVLEEYLRPGPGPLRRMLSQSDCACASPRRSSSTAWRRTRTTGWTPWARACGATSTSPTGASWRSSGTAWRPIWSGCSARIAGRHDDDLPEGYAERPGLAGRPLPDPRLTGHHGDANAAAGPLQDLIRLVETFGFHLVHLDIRQESTRHTQAVTELFARQPGAPFYSGLRRAERSCGSWRRRSPIPTPSRSTRRP